MKRILVTGGSGYIGSHTLDFLRECGYAVDNYDLVYPKDDIRDTTRLEKRLSGCDVIFHLAAIPHPFKGKECDYRIVNYELAQGVFHAAVRAGVKKFIFASSGCVYGVWGGHGKPVQFPVTEENPSPSLAEGQTLYGYFKLEFERFLEKNAKANNIHCVALRIEGLNSNPATNKGLLGRFFGNSRPEEQSCKLEHFIGNCSPENYQQLLRLVIEKDLESYFEALNVDNGSTHPSIDPHAVVRERWPGVPDHMEGPHASLISIAKASRLLGYSPVEPASFALYRMQQENKIISLVCNRSDLFSFQELCATMADNLKKQGIKRVSIWGAGKNGRLLYGVLSAIGCEVDRVYDDSATGKLGAHAIKKYGTQSSNTPVLVALHASIPGRQAIMERLVADKRYAGVFE